MLLFGVKKKSRRSKEGCESQARIVHMMLLACRFYWCRHHQHFVYLLLVSSPPPQRLQFTVFFLAVNRETAGWCCFFFALTLIISSYSWIIFFPSRLLFTHFLANHREILSYFEWNKKWVDFFLLATLFFGIFYISSMPAMHLIRTVSWCLFYLCLCGCFSSFISLLLCSDTEQFLGRCFSLTRTAFFPFRFCLFNNNVDVVPQFSVDHCIAKGKHSRLLTVKRIINVFGVGFLFIFLRKIRTHWKLQTTIEKKLFFMVVFLPLLFDVSGRLLQHKSCASKETNKTLAFNRASHSNGVTKEPFPLSRCENNFKLSRRTHARSLLAWYNQVSRFKSPSICAHFYVTKTLFDCIEIA